MNDELWSSNQDLQRSLEAVTVERDKLKHLLSELKQAVINKGSHPDYHDSIYHRHRFEWPFLWKRIDNAIEAVKND